MNESETTQRIEQLKRLALSTPEPLRKDYNDEVSWERACKARLEVVNGYWDEYGRIKLAALE